MSGLVSGISKVFTSIAGGAAKLGSAVRAVGASLFTASAATGGGLTSGLLNGIGGNGILGNILSGALKQGLAGALIGGIAGGVTGQGFGKGAMWGGLAGAAAGGLGGAFTPTGMGVDPTVTGSVAAANTPTGAAPKFLSGIGSPGVTPPTSKGGLGTALGFGEGGFFRTEGGAGLLAGLGSAAGDIYAAKSQEEQAQADRDFLLAKEKRRTNSYKVDPNSLVGGGKWGGDPTYRPTPAVAWAYNPDSGMIERGA